MLDEGLHVPLISKKATSREFIVFSTDQPEDVGPLLQLVRDKAKENGGMSVIAKKAGISREALYRALSPNGNPTIKTLTSVLSAIGLGLSVTGIDYDVKDDELA